MNIEEAAKIVIEEAQQPRKNPPNTGEYVSMTGDQMAERSGGVQAALDSVVSTKWHEEMSEAQRAVAEFIWDKMARHQQEREPFIEGFLKEYNMSHELVTWLKMTYIFDKFTSRYRSESKEKVMAVLCGMSLGFSDIINEIRGKGRRDFLLELCQQTGRGTTHFGDVNFQKFSDWDLLKTNPPYGK